MPIAKFKVHTGLFRPINNICISCPHAINVTTERAYIVWNPRERKITSHGGRVRYEGAYRRECAKCHDAYTGRYERRSTADAMITGENSVK